MVVLQLKVVAVVGRTPVLENSDELCQFHSAVTKWTQATALCNISGDFSLPERSQLPKRETRLTINLPALYSSQKNAGKKRRFANKHESSTMLICSNH